MMELRFEKEGWRRSGLGGKVGIGFVKFKVFVRYLEYL